MPLLNSLSDGLERLRSNPITIALVLVVAVVTGLGSFTDSASKLMELFARPSPDSARADLAKLGVPFTVEALQERAHDGDLVAVEKLLQAGISVDAISEQGNDDRPNVPALAEAAARADVAMVRALLASHADPNADDGAAVRAAARHGNVAVLQLLLKQHPSEQTLHKALVSAASQNKSDIVRLLAKQLANPRPALSQALLFTSGPGGWDPADLVALDRLLLQLGADPNASDADGITPLMLAADGGTVEQIGVLLQAGAMVNTRCVCPDWFGGGWTALAMAAKQGNADMVIRLIGAGADVNVRNADGDTPLILATRRPSIEAVKALLAAGADVNARARNGDSAQAIAKRGILWPDRTVYSPELIQLLSSKGGKR